jgi:hypothetical protein
LIRRYYQGYEAVGREPRYHPFRRIIFTPLFTPPRAVQLFRELASENPDPSVTLMPELTAGRIPRPTLMFDSGGYQVQMGKMTYDELCGRLRRLYDEERWGDYYVLPDHVPTSGDSDRQASEKASETLAQGELFLDWFPERRENFIGVVHGRTEDEMRRGAARWRDLGVSYIAFGSFGTSGPNGSVNMVSQRSISLLQALSASAREYAQRIHIFGIGNPGYIAKFQANGADAISFDSSGWWKMAGFGYVLHERKFVNICSKGRMTKTLASLEEDMPQSEHSCPFCADIPMLRAERQQRVLHNISYYAEVVRAGREWEIQ